MGSGQLFLTLLLLLSIVADVNVVRNVTTVGRLLFRIVLVSLQLYAIAGPTAADTAAVDILRNSCRTCYSTCNCCCCASLVLILLSLLLLLLLPQLHIKYYWIIIHVLNMPYCGHNKTVILSVSNTTRLRRLITAIVCICMSDIINNYIKCICVLLNICASDIIISCV